MHKLFGFVAQQQHSWQSGAVIALENGGVRSGFGIILEKLCFTISAIRLTALRHGQLQAGVWLTGSEKWRWPGDHVLCELNNADPQGGKIKKKSGTNWRNERVALQGIKRSIITELQQSSKCTPADCSITDAVRWHDRIKQDASCYLPGRFPRWVWTLSPSYALWPGAPSSAAAPPSEAPRCQGEKYRVGLYMRTSVMKENTIK